MVPTGARYVRKRTDGPYRSGDDAVDQLVKNERVQVLGGPEWGLKMSANWIYSSRELPREGQQIEFVLDCRDVAMEGTYMHRTFCSHWAEYEVDQFRSWRRLVQGRNLTTIPAVTRTERASSSASHHFMSDQLLHAGEGPDVA